MEEIFEFYWTNNLTPSELVGKYITNDPRDGILFKIEKVELSNPHSSTSLKLTCKAVGEPKIKVDKELTCFYFIGNEISEYSEMGNGLQGIDLVLLQK